MTAMHWPKTLGGFFCLRSRKSKKGTGMAALAGWRHRASFPGPRPGHRACDRYKNYYLYRWNCQIQGLETSSIRQKNKIEKSLAAILHPQLLGQVQVFGSPLLGGAQLSQPRERRDGGDKIRGDKIRKQSCAQQPLLPMDFPLENTHTWGGAGGGAAVLSRRMLSLGWYCCRERSGVPEGASSKLQEKTMLVWEDG